MTDVRLIILLCSFTLVLSAAVRHAVLAQRAGTILDILLIVAALIAALMPMAAFALRFLGVTQ